MQLIKANIRTNMIDKVNLALEAGGYTDMTVVDVRAIRGGIATNQTTATCVTFILPNEAQNTTICRKKL